MILPKHQNLPIDSSTVWKTSCTSISDNNGHNFTLLFISISFYTRIFLFDLSQSGLTCPHSRLIPPVPNSLNLSRHDQSSIVYSGCRDLVLQREPFCRERVKIYLFGKFDGLR